MFYLYGASGHAKVIVDMVSSAGKSIEGIFDDDINKKSTFSQIEFCGKYDYNLKLPKYAKFLICIGDNKIRASVSKKIKQNFFSFNDKSSIISKNVKIGNGTVVMPNAIINSDAIIGDHCIVNTAAIVEHDCNIEDFVHIAPNSTITGNVKIGIGSFVGANTTIIPGIKIGKWCVIGAGSVIINDIPDYAVVVGNPGKIIKYNER